MKTSTNLLKLILLLLCIGSWGNVFAQPANDDCGGAFSLTVNTDLACGATTAGTIASATASPEDPSACTGTEDDDVWFSFTATAPQHRIELLNIANGTTNLNHSVWEGSCGGLTLVPGSCSDPNNSTVLALTVGNTYYLRVYSWTLIVGQTTTFDVCIGTYAEPLTNDDCSGALILNVNPDFLCENVTSGTIEFATASPEDPSACDGVENDDVWFSFTATSSFHSIDLLNVAGSTTDLYHSVWEGSCGDLTLVDGSCSDFDHSTLSDLTIGNTYYLRVYSYYPISGENSTFDVCIGTNPPPPANDDCGGAFELTVNPDLACGTITPATIISATASPEDPSACSGTEDDDVWFLFTATATVHLVELLNITNGTTNLNHSIWEGSCGGLTLLAGSCSDPNNSTVSGLTVGNTYYLRVYSWTSSPGQTTTFDVCIGTYPPPPANDDCGGALPLTVNPDLECGSVTAGTILSATASPEDASACSGTENDDVWFSFTATETAHSIDLLNVTGSTTDLYHSVWEGSCGGLTLLAGSCSDPNNSTVSGLTVGNTYYLRVYSWWFSSGQTTTFDVCIGTYPSPPANDDCDGALPLTLNAGFTCGSVTPATIASATASPEDATACSGTEDDDVWFSFTATATLHRIDLLNVAGSTTDLYHSVWEGGCGNLTLLAGSCSDPNNSTVTGLTVGNTYFLRVYSYTSTGGQTTTFDVCIGSPLLNDDCGGAFELTVNADLECGNTTAGTIEFATASPEDPAACSGTEDDDVWFSFTATATLHKIDLLNVAGSTADLNHSVWEGACGGLTLVAGSCASPNNSIVTGLTIGNTYFLRVYSWTSTGGQTTTFDVCIGTYIPPANDECDGAFALTMNTDLECGIVTSGTLENATASPEDDTACAGAEDDDVWFSFTATATTHRIDFVNIHNPSTAIISHSVWEGSCGGLILVPGSCTYFVNNASNVYGLTIGQTYYLRAYSETATGGQATTFDVCLRAPPVHDNCLGAITIPVTADACNGVTTGYNNVATDSNFDVPAPPAATCPEYEGGDIWFTLTVPASGNVVISGSNTVWCCDNLWYEVYTGADCADLTSIACSDTYSGSDSNDPSTYPTELSGLTPGSMIWIRAWDGFNDNGSWGEFNFCAYEPACIAPTVTFPTNPVDNTNCPATVDVSISIDDLGDSGSLTISAEDDMGNPAGTGGTVTATGVFTITDIPVPQTSWSIIIAHESNPVCNVTLGPYLLNCPPLNDAVCDAVALTLNAPQIPGVNIYSTFETDESVGSCWGGGTFNVGNSVWYLFVAPPSGEVEITTDFVTTLDDSQMALYEITDCNDLTTAIEVGCSEDDGITGDGYMAVIETSGAPLTGGATYYVQVDGYGSSVGNFEIQVNDLGPLPVELLSFEGKREKYSNILMWKTATEENTERHVIERSIDGRDWEVVGETAAAGFSSQIQSYQLEDSKPLAKSYYRLRSVDFDGHQDISRMVYLERETNRFDIITTYPVPTKASLTIVFEMVESKEVDIRMTDLLGNVVSQHVFAATKGINSETLEMNQLSVGVYFLTIHNGIESITKRIVKN